MLATDASLKIECTGCGAARTLSALEVVKRCEPGDLAAIRGRLKCDRCGIKDAQPSGGAAARLTIACVALLTGF